VAAGLGKLAPIVAETAFRQRVALGFIVVAAEVRAEDPATNGHALRRRLADSVLMNDPANSERYAGLVATHPAVVELDPSNSSSITDDHIYTAVRERWNALANVDE
jgi:hypothetical protein